MATPAAEQNVQNRRRNTEQRRGERAWQCVQDAKRVLDKKQKEYRARALGLNAMVQINGLGQTLAFFQAKGRINQEYKLLFEQLSKWVSGEILHEERSDLLAWIVSQASGAQYRQATAECMAFGIWLKRFAEAELEEGDER
jgi:CRISPR-associated protein Cmr5